MARQTLRAEIPNRDTNAIDDCWNRIGVRGDHSCPSLAEHIHCRNCPVYSEAAATFLDGELAIDSRRQWAIDYAKTKESQAVQNEVMVVFRVGDEWLGLAAHVCSEFAEISLIHALPHRRDGIVLGLANVRGELLICASLAELLGIEAATINTDNELRKTYSRLIVMRDGDNIFAAPVDEVFGLVPFHASQIGNKPSSVGQAAVTYTRGVLAWQGCFVGLIDHELLFYSLNRSLT